MSDAQTRDRLVADLTDASARVRQRAALTLSTTPDATLEDALVNAAVREHDAFVRDTLTRALVACGEGVVPRLIALLGDSDAVIRQHAAHVLGKRADRGATDALLRAATDVDPVVVYKAVFALGRIRDARAVDTLVQALAHEDDQVRRAARDALQSFGAAAVPSLVAALSSDSNEQRRQISYALAAAGSVSALTAVRELLADAEPTVRFAALHALGTADPVAAAGAAASMRDDPDVKIRALASRY